MPGLSKHVHGTGACGDLGESDDVAEVDRHAVELLRLHVTVHLELFLQPFLPLSSTSSASSHPLFLSPNSLPTLSPSPLLALLLTVHLELLRHLHRLPFSLTIATAHSSVDVDPLVPSTL